MKQKKLNNLDNTNYFGNFYDRFNTKNPLAKLIMYYYIKSIKSLVFPLDIDNILEVGCGEGHLTQIIHDLKPVSEIIKDISE